MPDNDILALLERLAGNFRWMWDRPTQQVFEYIDPEAWGHTHDPHEILRSLRPDWRKTLGTDRSFVELAETADGGLTEYLANQPSQPSVAYFCMEHGVAPVLRTYAGGLGMLAGCIEKSASDLGIPMVAVGLRYQTRFIQRLSFGWQSEEWVSTDALESGLEQCPDGQIELDLAGERLTIAVWRARVGRVQLFLLDTNVAENPEHLRGITDRLYMGDKEHRLRQEIVLGIGGVRVLAALGLRPTVYHANEGHAGFMALERIEREVSAGVGVDDALARVRAATIFTTHTAMPAGFDMFERSLIEKYFSAWIHRCGVSLDWLMELGHFPGFSGHDPFNMAVLCAKCADYINAVSRLHREITEQRVLGPLWPGHAAPIRPITNGVHPRTWTPPRMADLFERYVGSGWDYAGPDDWQGIFDVPDSELWRLRGDLRSEMVDYVRWYLPRSLRQQGWSASLEWAEGVLDPKALTIVVARRAAEYKETDLLVSSPDRLKALIHAAGQPVNVIFSGVAHPSDEGGKERIRRIVEFSFADDVRSKVIYLPNYDMRLAQALLAGADIWLNHPRRGDEACGTSFMKAVFCGGQILTTADGGADELIVHGDNGWIIGDRSEGSVREMVVSDLFGLLNHVIVPKFYDRFDAAVPSAWVEGIKQSLASLAWRVSAATMMTEYQRLYRDARRRYRRMTEHPTGSQPEFAPV
jgi:starch phosphorylase